MQTARLCHLFSVRNTGISYKMERCRWLQTRQRSVAAVQARKKPKVPAQFWAA